MNARVHGRQRSSGSSTGMQVQRSTAQVGTDELELDRAENGPTWEEKDEEKKVVRQGMRTHQSTNCTVRLFFMVATADCTSLGVKSPRYIIQQAMYLPCLGSHLAIMEAGSKTVLVISATDSCSWYAFSAEITGA
ncbi:hypothetical protein Mapa_013858 [Marchantia paleacea]|nr:hypothetical protein Mapa_013858 [Marchantia paleacea]